MLSTHICKCERFYNGQSVWYFFYMKTNVLQNFHICISVPLKKWFLKLFMIFDWVEIWLQWNPLYHTTCVVIIFYNTGLSKSAFSTYSFRTLVFVFLCAVSFQFDVLFIGFVYNIYLIIFYKYMYKRHLAISDVATYLTSALTHISKKHASIEAMSFFSKKRFIKKNVEQSQNITKNKIS